MKVYRSEKEMIQNLKDADCDEYTIKLFLEALQAGKKNQGIILLQKQRRCLLESLHKSQKKIDALDYLLYIIKV